VQRGTAVLSAVPCLAGARPAASRGNNAIPKFKECVLNALFQTEHRTEVKIRMTNEGRRRMGRASRAIIRSIPDAESESTPPGPLANDATQLVGLLLQLTDPLRLHGEIAAEFRRSGLRQRPTIRRAEIARVCVTRGLGLRTSASHPLLPPILTGGIADVCTLCNGQSVCFGVCVEEAARSRGFDVT